MNKLLNKIAIVTGGSNGIGAATVIRFIKEDASVVIWDVKEPTENSAISELIKKSTAKIEFMTVNVADLKSAEDAAAAVKNNYGKIDILINNAGITMDSTLMKMTEDKWQKVIDINLTGVFNCAKSVIPYMIENKYGKIINASSVVGLYGNFGQTNYVASKAGVIGMTKVWARELGRKGINVNAVAPGFIATEMVAGMPENVINVIIQTNPLLLSIVSHNSARRNLPSSPDEADFIN